MTSAAIHVDQLWFQIPGGVGAYIRHLVPAMIARDPALDLRPFRVRLERAPADGARLEGLGVVEVPGSIRTLYPSWNALGRPRLPQALTDTDVIHATSGSAVPPAAPGQRLVATVHDLAFLHLPGLFPTRWRLLYRLGLRAAVKRADAILTPSRSTAEDLVSSTRVDPARVHVAPLATALPIGQVDPAEAASRLGLPIPYLLFVGTLEPRKNLVRLVRAYRRAAAGGVPHGLVLAGPLGWHPDALLRELALEGPGAIVRTGHLAARELDAVYRGASAFAYPSLSEGFGLPVLEAMARGVPTITSNTSSLPEVAGEAALCVDPRSVEELATAIQRVLTDPTVGARLADAGRRRAERFSWDETARLTLETYARVLGAA